MSVIYTPKGRAREYSPLALNVYSSCAHGCKYCYAPHVLQRTAESYFSFPKPRQTVISELTNLLKKENITNQVLMSFVGDPYSPSTDDNMVTREALELLRKNNVPVAVLTKGGKRCLRDLDVFKSFKKSIMVGASLTFSNESLSKEWEPYAATPDDRLEALSVLKMSGVRTFASFEPVINAQESLDIMKRTIDNDCVDLYKIGKLNGMSKIEKTIDWTDFLSKALDMLRAAKKEIYVKNDLAESAPSIVFLEGERDADIHTVKSVKTDWFS